MVQVQLAYGSFGDIAATVQIAIQIARALYDPEASDSQRTLVQEVNLAQQLLLQIQDAVKPIHTGSGSISTGPELCAKIQDTVACCH